LDRTVKHIKIKFQKNKTIHTGWNIFSKPLHVGKVKSDATDVIPRIVKNIPMGEPTKENRIWKDVLFIWIYPMQKNMQLEILIFHIELVTE
jgi:hypothetical protein